MRVMGIFLLFQFFGYLWLAICELRNEERKNYRMCECRKKRNNQKNYVDETLNEATKKIKKSPERFSSVYCKLK